MDEKLKELLNELHEYDKEIVSLQKKRTDKYEEINRALELFGLKLQKCKTCMGTGVVSYTYGYQDGSLGFADCSECNGTTYSVMNLN